MGGLHHGTKGQIELNGLESKGSMQGGEAAGTQDFAVGWKLGVTQLLGGGASPHLSHNAGPRAADVFYVFPTCTNVSSRPQGKPHMMQGLMSLP